MADFPHVPGYELQAELGRGGMAVVYSAIETNLGRYVAIKVVTASAELMEGQIERLENEARGLATLHHPHIVDLYRFGRTSDGALYYVMPLLPGGSLEDWPKPAPEERVVALLETVLDALGHAHASDIIHRDIKPANILFDQYDRPQLADFGAAFMRGRSTRLTSQGIAIGSSGYMSPEQARGLDVDARSDLYSTAVLAFELLTGKRPFEGPDDLSIAIAQTEQPVPRMPEALKHWQAFFYRALAVTPEHRFPSSAAMLAAIHALQKPPRVRRPGLVMALVVVVVLIGVLAIAARGWKSAVELVRVEPALAEAVRAEAVEALMRADHLTPPSDPNALSELVRARGQVPERARLDSLQEQLLAGLAADVGSASDRGDAAASAAAWRRWQNAVALLEVAVDPGVIAQQAGIEEKLRTQFADALAKGDARAAGPALAVVKAWDTAPEALRKSADEVIAIVSVGDRFTDKGGPELVLARKPEGSRPALAVMAAAVDSKLYARYAKDRGRTAVSCAASAAPAQGCLDLATANDFSRWLSKQAGHKYRVPSRTELAAVMKHVETGPAYAWTSTCNEVHITQKRNVAKRTWSGVKKLFGKPTPPKVEIRCEGNFALKLDGRGNNARVHTQATPETTVVLVREMMGKAD